MESVLKRVARLAWVFAVLVAALLVGVILLAAQPARAQGSPQCAPWPVMAAALAEKYREAVLFEGLPPEGSPAPRIVITAARDGSTWTALTVETSGQACIRGFGGGWRAGPAAPLPGEEG